MSMSSLAGKPAPPAILVNVPRLVTAYYTDVPDPSVPAQRVVFGTSGHRGSAFNRSFNEWHVLAISEAICRYRRRRGIDGPLFLGVDTHALSEPACASALEVLAAHRVEVMIARNNEYTPTPAVSHAILKYNHGRTAGLADGIVVTPSHNPPEDGGFKYNPPNGGPADETVTAWIEDTANRLARTLAQRRSTRDAYRPRCAPRRRTAMTTFAPTSAIWAHVIDMEVLKGAGIRIGVDPLGGAGVHYWAPIAERYRLNLTVVNDAVDPTFRFMTVDWDGRIRMDPSSPRRCRV